MPFQSMPDLIPRDVLLFGYLKDKDAFYLLATLQLSIFFGHVTQSKRKEKYFHKLSVELLRFNFKYNTVNEENFTIKKLGLQKKRKSRLECNLANTS